MFLILKVILIILLNKTYAYITKDSEIILLPARNLTSAKKIPLTLNVFGKQIQLNLRRNDQIAPASKVWKHNVKKYGNITEKLSQLNAPGSCYYFHEDHISIAVINFCQKHGLEGVVFLENTTLDISPLQNNLASSSLIGDSCVETETNVSFGKPHLIKQHVFRKHLSDSDLFHVNNRKPRQRRSQDTPIQNLNLELAIFLDKAAFNNLLLAEDRDPARMRDILVAYVKGLEAVFQHPSLGVSFNILLKYMEIMKHQPIDMPHHEGYVYDLLNSFCKYAYKLQDGTKYHWDVALYLTGFDLTGEINLTYQGRTQFTSAGSRTSLIRGWPRAKNGVCIDGKSCAVVEFGVRSQNKNIPTSGFSSIYAAAEEIGRLLGMVNDGIMGNECEREGYIMSFKWDSEQFAKTNWSECSREVVTNLALQQTKQCLLDGQPENITYQYRYIESSEHITSTTYEIDNYDDIKKKWSAKKQCELFLHDKRANLVISDNLCRFLQCEAPDQGITNIYDYLNHKYIFYHSNFFAGPALEGTHCAPHRECRYGTCSLVEPSKYLYYSEDGSWSEWNVEPCAKNCLEKSKGTMVARRTCSNKNNKPAYCAGSSYDVKLCDASSLCSEKPRLPIEKYIDISCEKARFLAKKGIQAPYDYNRPWLACTIFCRGTRKEDGDDDVITYYSLADKLTNSVERNLPYLPEGTACHTDNETGLQFYCRKHQCLLETSRTVNCRKSIY
ncbi:A disintegrin and metalloproteinase with thrombospondin motifs adt-2-like [Linepithema humile]|uniref:A disintegrin and metalloproteinase with thrombospondin motifs adt-2-like n=1 Tax=Linepithema humile TaxID=83485 RepID=UPI00351E1D6A